MSPRLAVSVVIGVHNARASIGLCLTALRRELRREMAGGLAEIIVADSSTDGTDKLVAQQFPEVRLHHFAEPLTLPELRGRAIAAARGDIIAVLDPYSVVREGWLSVLIAAHAERANLIIGGAVGLYGEATCSLSRWALFINEYGMFMPPVPAGKTAILPGSNISYKRTLLFQNEQAQYPVFWKTFANWDAEARGSALWLEPALVVDLYKPIPLFDFWRTRFWHGRCFAGMRVAEAPLGTRLIRAASTPVVPFLLLWRWGKKYGAKGRQRDKFILTVPWQLLLFGQWAMGEFVGYLFGPGRSCEKLFY